MNYYLLKHWIALFIEKNKVIYIIRWKDECSKCQGQIGFLKFNLQDFQRNYSFRQWYYDQPRQHIKKQRHYSANKGLSSQSYSFSSSHVQMWELDHKEGWTPKNWCFQTLMLEKTLENPLDCKEIKPVILKGNQPWIVTGRTDAKDEAQILWPPDAKMTLFTSGSGFSRRWCWERLNTKGERGGRGWDGWIASLTQWAWIWVNFGR